MHQRCDVLIVGGGPAGSTCARRLRAAGLDVVVMDKRPFPRDKPCAGWITPPVLKMLDIDPLDYARGRVLQPITSFSVGRMNHRIIATDFGEIVSYGIRRCEFDAWLLARAGARCRLDESVRSIKRLEDGWLVNDGVRAGLIVGAGGHFCPVARHLGARPGGPDLVVAAQEAEFEMTPAQAAACRVRPEGPELYFCEDLQGYGWCFRKGHYLNVGLGRESRAGLAGHVDAMVQWLRRSGRVPFDIPACFVGHAYSLYGHSRRELVGDGMLLVGDAACLAAPYSGEGIRAAVESALMAADAIVAAAGDYRREALEPYGAALVDRFGEPEASDGWLAHIPPWLKRALAGPLFASSWFTRRVVLEKWFLATNAPTYHVGVGTGAAS